MLSQIIVLMGIKHCGKSTQARLLSKKFDCPSFDTDELIEKVSGQTPRQIYLAGGKQAFMQAEYDACVELKSILQKLEGPLNSTVKAIVATGGGICDNDKAIELLKSLDSTLVFLNAFERTAADRIVREIQYLPDGTMQNLPAYISRKNPKDESDVRDIFHEFYLERKRLYRNICIISVDMKPVSKKKNLEFILQALGVSVSSI